MSITHPADAISVGADVSVGEVLSDGHFLSELDLSNGEDGLALERVLLLGTAESTGTLTGRSDARFVRNAFCELAVASIGIRMAGLLGKMVL